MKHAQYTPNVGPVDSGTKTRYQNADGTYTVNYGTQTWIEDASGNKIPLGPPDQPASQWNAQTPQYNTIDSAPPVSDIQNQFPDIPPQGNEQLQPTVPQDPQGLQPFTGMGTNASPYGGPTGVPLTTDNSYGQPAGNNPTFPGWNDPVGQGSWYPAQSSIGPILGAGPLDSASNVGSSSGAQGPFSTNIPGSWLANIPADSQAYYGNRGVTNYDPTGTSGIPNMGDLTSSGMGAIS